MWRGIDAALRAVYVLICPIGIGALAGLLPITGIVVNAALATGIALAGARAWEARVKNIRFVGRSLANFGRLGAYYETTPVRPLLYYLLYPLFAPYWLFKRSAREELFLYRRLGVLALLITVVASAVEYLQLWAPLPFSFFATAMVATVVLQLLFTCMFVMPLVTTVIEFQRRGRRVAIVGLLGIGIALGFAGHAGAMKDGEAPLPTQERMFARATWQPDLVRAQINRATAAAFAVYDARHDVAAAEAAGRAELTMFHEDERRAFHLFVRPPVLVFGARVARKHAIWRGRDATGALTSSARLPDDVRAALKVTDLAPWP